MKIEFKATGAEPVTMDNTWEDVLSTILSVIGEKQGSFDLRELEVSVVDVEDVDDEMLENIHEECEACYVWRAEGINID